MLRLTALTGMLVSLLAAGCVDRSPPPPRVAVPQDPGDGPLRRSDPQKPMPADLERMTPPPPAFNDVALINQEMPEMRAFLDAYQRVGRPILQINNARPEDDNPENTTVILQMIDWLRCGGRVDLLAPRSQKSVADVAVLLTIDVLRDKDNAVQSVRLAAVANNAADGLLLGQAIIDMPQPIDREAINRYTRFVARKLMSEMTTTWNNTPEINAPRAASPPVESPARPEPAPAPQTAPDLPPQD